MSWPLALDRVPAAWAQGRTLGLVSVMVASRSQPKVDRCVSSHILSLGSHYLTQHQFNLETPNSELFLKDAREPYKSVSQHPPPPLEIQVLFAVPDLAHTNQGPVLRLPDSSRTRIHLPLPNILPEPYTMSFMAGPSPADVLLLTIYKPGSRCSWCSHRCSCFFYNCLHLPIPFRCYRFI